MSTLNSYSNYQTGGVNGVKEGICSMPTLAPNRTPSPSSITPDGGYYRSFQIKMRNESYAIGLNGGLTTLARTLVQ